MTIYELMKVLAQSSTDPNDSIVFVANDRRYDKIDIDKNVAGDILLVGIEEDEYGKEKEEV